jgi:hypothetical protein
MISIMDIIWKGQKILIDCNRQLKDYILVGASF